MSLEKVPSAPESDTVPEGPMVFNHPDDREFWKNIAPYLSDDPTDQEKKPYINVENYMKQSFPNAKDLAKNLKFIKRCLIGHSEYESEEVHVQKFVWLTRCFGPFVNTATSCFFLEQIQKLTSYTLKMSCGKVSPFAGVMNQEEAERRLTNKNVPVESYLVRFSESLSDRGGFSIAVKANATQVHHYNVVGKPDKALGDPRYYNSQLRLVHYNNTVLDEEEEPYRDIVHFMKTRLTDEIEDGVYCTHVCPDLPCNVLFSGYR